MPKLKHFAIATGVVGGFLATVGLWVGALIWLQKTYPDQFWLVIGACAVAVVIFCFAANYAAQDEIMKGNDDG